MRIAWLLIVAALSLTRLGAAQPRAAGASLVVTRGDGAQDCPDAATIAEQVRNITGASVITPGLASGSDATVVQVAIGRGFGNYSAQINAFGARHGFRALEDLGPGCASLADAVAVTIAIFLDPYAAAPPPPRPVPPPPVLRPEPKVSPLEPKLAAPFFVRASGGTAIRLLEHTQPMLSGALGWQLDGRWSLALGGGLVFGDSVSTAGGSVDLRLSYGYLEACGRALGASDHPNLASCVGLQSGSLSAAGRGYLHASTERALFFALAAGPQLLFPVSPAWSWVFTGQLVVPFSRPGFDVQSSGVRSAAFRAPAVGGFLGLGLRGAL